MVSKEDGAVTEKVSAFTEVVGEVTEAVGAVAEVSMVDELGLISLPGEDITLLDDMWLVEVTDVEIISDVRVTLVDDNVVFSPRGLFMLGYLSGQISSLHSRIMNSCPSILYLQMFGSLWVQLVGRRLGHCQGSKVLFMSWSRGVGSRDHAMSCDMVTMYTSSRLPKWSRKSKKACSR